MIKRAWLLLHAQTKEISLGMKHIAKHEAERHGLHCAASDGIDHSASMKLEDRASTAQCWEMHQGIGEYMRAASLSGLLLPES
jgi:hypothetical protein